MSYIEKNTNQLIDQNEQSYFELASNNQQDKHQQIYSSEIKSKSKVFHQDEEYAYQESQHTRLIGDIAASDQQMVSTTNWKDSIRKQYGVQKCKEYKDPEELNRTFILFNKFKTIYIKLFPIIDPQNEFITYWKIPVLIITIMIFVEIPLIIFFSDDFYYTFRDPYYKFYRTQSILIYAIDMFIEFHVAFKHHGILVQNRWRVADHYFKGRFIFDFIPIMVLIITSFSYYLANIYDLYLLFLLKVYPAYKINQRFVDKLVVYPAWKSFYLISRMVIELVYLTHFFGCIFFGTAVYMLKKAENEGVHVNSWLTFNTGNFGVIERYDWTKRYILSTYWAFATLTTVAYGDITPMNEFEIIVSEVAMVAALFLVAMNVANIQQTFIDYYEDKRKYQKEIIAITKFMRYKQISKETEQEIKNYLDHYFKEKLNRDTELEEQVIQKLAKTLKAKLMFESYQKYLFSVPWIRCNFSEDVIKALSQGFQEIDYSAKENIFLDKGFDNQDDSSLYFVQVGHIELFIDVPESDRHEVILANLKQGAHFGDYGFITGMQRRASARSKKYSQVLQLKRSSFMDILMQYPHDHQRFCYLRDELLFNNSYHELGLSCFTCSSLDHMSIECSLTHLNIGYEAVRQCRQRIIDRSSLAQIEILQIQNRAIFQRTNRIKNNIFIKQQLNPILLELYYYKTQEKIKQEAFSGEHQIIIQSFCLDKIHNFLDYYPQYNFDLLLGHKDKPLIFAKQASKRLLD